MRGSNEKVGKIKPRWDQRRLIFGRHAHIRFPEQEDPSYMS